MTKLEKLERHVRDLSAEELSKFRAWFAEFDARAWDSRIKADSTAETLVVSWLTRRADHSSVSRAKSTS